MTGPAESVAPSYEQLDAACRILAAENERLRDALGAIANTDVLDIARSPWRIGRLAARALVDAGDDQRCSACGRLVWWNGQVWFHKNPTDDDHCPLRATAPRSGANGSARDA